MERIGNTEFRQRIHRCYDSLSKGQKRLADAFLGGNPNIAFLSAAQLAEKLGTSRSSLVRFAQAVGYRGYPELQNDVQSHLKERLTPTSALHSSLETMGVADKDEYEAFKHVINIDLEALQSLPEQIPREHFEVAVRTLTNTDRIFVFGLGVCESLADFLSFRLRRYGLDVRQLNQGGTGLYDQLLLFEPGSCLVAFGFHRYPKELSVVLEQARKQRMSTVLMTDDPNGPYNAMADVALAGRRGPLGIMHSLVVPMAVINALVLAVGYHEDGKVLESLETLDQLRYGYENQIPRHQRDDLE